MSRLVRRQLLARVLSGILSLLAATAVWAQSTPPISGAAALDVVNRASAEIIDVRLASRAMNGWGNNLVASPVGAAQKRRVVPERQEGCLYAIRIVYRDNRFERFAVIDLCRNNEYVFAAKTAQPIASQSAYNAPPVSEVGIFNRSSKTINFIRMAPAGDRMWGPDRLGTNRTLTAGQSMNVPLEGGRGCFYRIRAFYDDNTTEFLPSANLCDDHSISFRRTAPINGDQVPANMRLETTDAIVVSNQSGLEVHWIYVFPRNQRDTSRDRLGNNEILASGRQRRIDISDQSACFATVLAVYRDKREESQSVDLCAVHEPTLTMRGPTAGPGQQPAPQSVQGVPSRP